MTAKTIELSTSVKTAAPHIESVLEQLYKDTSLEDQYKNEIAALFQELLVLIHQFNTFVQESNITAALTKALEISTTSLRTGQKLTEIEFLEERDTLVKLALELGIDAVIDTTFLAQRSTLKTQRIFYHKKLFGGLGIAQHPITVAFIQKSGLVLNSERYIRALLILNNSLTTKESDIKKSFRRGFGKSVRKSGTLLEINKLRRKFINLLNFALTVNQEEESILYLTEISWSSYENLSRVMADESWCRISYANATLELLVPKKPHEITSGLIRSLIEAYFYESEVPYCSVGSADIKKENVQIVKQPDLSYIIGTDCRTIDEEDIPHLAIEVNCTNGRNEDLEEKYQPLGVPEVWMWDKKNGLKFYILGADGYSEILCSQYLSEITSEMMNKYLKMMKDTSNITVRKEFVREVQSRI